MGEYATGTTSNCTTATEISTGTITGVYDYTSQVKGDFNADPLVALQKYGAQDYSIPVQIQKEPKQNKSQKMEVELCLCSKALWS